MSGRCEPPCHAYGLGDCPCDQPLATPAERAAADELTALTEEMGLYDATMGTALGGGVHGQTTAEGPNRSGTTAADASPKLAEPTAADLDQARFALWPECATDDPDGLLWQHALAGDKDAVKRVAQVLAAQRAAIHARYEAVAVGLDDTAAAYWDEGVKQVDKVRWTKLTAKSYGFTHSARRIRQVAAQ